MENKIIVVYGSLKLGKYNHYLLGEEHKFLGEKMIHGVMQLNGNYPYLFDSLAIKRKGKQYTAEVYEIPQNVFNCIAKMEKGAGYYERDIKTDWGMGTLFMTQPSLFSKDKNVVEQY